MKIKAIATLGASTSFGIQRSANADSGDVRCAAAALVPFPLRGAATCFDSWDEIAARGHEAGAGDGYGAGRLAARLLRMQHEAPGAKRCAHPGARAVRYFTFAARASAASALFASCCEFMNFVTTSEIAPAVASPCAMPCASDGT
ncbi:Uncharacterised protein [Burkholderia mallei]|nr:Uncharacterised protein [Burkholderia mallei]